VGRFVACAKLVSKQFVNKVVIKTYSKTCGTFHKSDSGGVVLSSSQFI